MSARLDAVAEDGQGLCHEIEHEISGRRLPLVKQGQRSDWVSNSKSMIATFSQPEGAEGRLFELNRAYKAPINLGLFPMVRTFCTMHLGGRRGPAR
jgi:hypothetical protein